MSSKLMKMALAALVFACAGAPAEDIDVFVGAPSVSGRPNVMIVLDNAANFSSNASGTSCIIDGAATALSGTVGGIEQCALYKVIKELKVPVVDGVETPALNIGMMVYDANNIRDINNLNCGGTVGGCLVQPLVPLTSANQTAFLAWIKSWKTTGGAGDGYIKANSEATGAAMQETWAYYSGHTGLSGRSYASIKPSFTACQNNYILFVGNSYTSSGTPGDATGDAGPRNALEGTNSTPAKNASPAATALQKAQILGSVGTSCGSYTFPSSSHENKGLYADEWARYLSAQMSVTTYTIGVLGGSCQAQYAALLSSMATYGKGKYFPTTNYDGLVLAIGTVLSEIQSKDSAFASASLPVSANTQGTYLNQVFIGMFRPNKDGTPRWYGNLKQYQFRADVDPGTGEIVSFRLVDKTGDYNVVSPLSGFVSPCAQSFWSTADTYWPSTEGGNCLISGMTDVRSNSPDGEVVEKGAAGQRLRAMSGASGAAARTVLTCSACGSGALADFGTSITPDEFGLLATDTSGRDALVAWARGQNVDDELGKGTTAIRPSVHGDVVHSAPQAVNYGSATAPDVVVFYGSNDGMLRAINGNKADTDGNELWSFVAPEHYRKFARLRSNSPGISFPGAAAGTTPKDYFFDGPIGLYRSDDLSSTWIYPTMRRGGRTLYAFDVSTPASPSLLWKIGCPVNFPTSGTVDDTGCTTGLASIGQTWSQPQVVKVEGYSTNPVLVVGGGYDTCEDQDAVPNTACTSSRKGNRVFVVDARTGAVLKTLGTGAGDGDAILGSVAAAVTVVDSNRDGVADYAYAVDTLANLYRINIGTLAPASWTVTRIASLGCDSGACGRKFLFAPTVRVGDVFDAVLVGSGNRERPLLSNTATASVDNAFFMIKDDHSASPSVITTSDLVSIDPDSTALTDAQKTALESSKGWYLALGTGDHDREQVVTSAALIGGVTFFSTNQPVEPTGCGFNLGTARGYAVSFLDASTPDDTTKFREFVGGGLPPSPVVGVASIILTTSDGRPWEPHGSPIAVGVPFVIGGGGGATGGPGRGGNSGCGSSGLGGCLITINPHHVPKRVYWYIQQ
jgi:type IV pilus assembly protein PilY1